MNMREYPLEPGLLSTFRLYVAGRLLFVVIAGGFYVAWYGPPIERGSVLSAIPFLADIVVLSVLLSVRHFRRWLGRLYLPLTLLVSVMGPIVQMGYVLPMYDTDAIFAFLLGFSLLLVPLLLTAWQYSFGWVLLLGLCTSLFEFLLLSSGANLTITGLRWSTVSLVGRSLLSIFVGYIVSNLIDQQRQQRHELARAYRQLVRYASTLEKLAVSRERNRLARELHDTLAHALSGLAVQLDAISAIWDPAPPRARAMLERSLSIARIGLDETRRALQALRATPLEDMGIVLAIRELAEGAAARGSLVLSLDLSDGLSNLAPEVEQCYYRVAQEALENVIRHAHATRVSVALRQDRGQLILEVSNDGRGFAEASTPSQNRLGIKGMHERAGLIGGTLIVESREGEGTTVRLTMENIDDSGAHM
jgi:signal transduction histidine kinase